MDGVGQGKLGLTTGIKDGVFFKNSNFVNSAMISSTKHAASYETGGEEIKRTAQRGDEDGVHRDKCVVEVESILGGRIGSAH